MHGVLKKSPSDDVLAAKMNKHVYGKLMHARKIKEKNMLI